MATPRAGSRDSSIGAQDEYIQEGRERGTRRRKLAGYLKAANELRQSYQQTYAPSWSKELEDDDKGIPGAFPDVAIVRNGDEEMMLFPSYARRHVASRPDFEHDGNDSESLKREGNDSESWKREWERHEDSKAIVDVDVRGWIYSPHRGPMNRKNRLLVGIARRLSGMPAPADENVNDHAAARAAKKEEELVLREAESITKRGDGEADVAWRGGYSEDPTTRDQSRSSTPVSAKPRPLTPDIEPLQKRASWNQPADMTDAELRTANSHLMARLKPFLSIPQANIPITVFFYDSETSQSRTIMTNEAGHFSLRAALDFVPTDVRVLASEGLSATEEVRVTEPSGVSLISDVDDTIKHSAVASGAREIFRNTFIRELKDLTIDGVAEWYTRMADLGVQIHYVSNSPWQLYPLLSSYFRLAGLPPGSFHLKQYSGMLQGIFEPVAERKKSTLVKIMKDFPDRKFLLVGDSGEADLEVYTDVVVANPGRIVAVFIRDVTFGGPAFFDSTFASHSHPVEPSKAEQTGELSTGVQSGASTGPQSRGTPSTGSQNRDIKSTRTSNEDLISLGGPDTQRQITNDTERPPLPIRPNTSASLAKMGTLIDFEDSTTPRPRPRPPAKPASLSYSAEIGKDQKTGQDQLKTPPPLPPKPARYLRADTKTDTVSTPGTPDARDGSGQSKAGSDPPESKPPDSTANDRLHDYKKDLQEYSQQKPLQKDSNSVSSAVDSSYRASIRQKMASAYNNLPSASSYLYGEPEQGSRNGSLSDSGASRPDDHPAPRRNLTAYPAAAAQYASSRIASTWAPQPDDSQSQVNKKEDMWKRRWVKAKEILDEQGVELRTWRVGEDVMADAVKMVEKTIASQKASNS